jgi:hypothetical protein
MAKNVKNQYHCTLLYKASRPRKSPKLFMILLKESCGKSHIPYNKNSSKSWVHWVGQTLYTLHLYNFRTILISWVLLFQVADIGAYAFSIIVLYIKFIWNKSAKLYADFFRICSYIRFSDSHKITQNFKLFMNVLYGCKTSCPRWILSWGGKQDVLNNICISYK